MLPIDVIASPSGEKYYYQYNSVHFYNVPELLLFARSKEIKRFNYWVVNPASIDTMINSILPSLETFPDKNCEAYILFKPGTINPTYLKNKISDLVPVINLAVLDPEGKGNVISLA